MRREDPRIAARIRAALGDARTVVNVGAGAGSYEPADLEVVAVEPSEVMIAQRPEGAAPVVRAVAEELPFEDGSFDAAMAVLSDHHWSDHARGLAELRRVARRVVLLTCDPATVDDTWLVSEYLPCSADIMADAFRLEQTSKTWAAPASSRSRSRTTASTASSTPTGGGRTPTSIRRCAPGSRCSRRWRTHASRRGSRGWRADLESGAWERRHADLLELEELDRGYRLLVHG